MKEYQLTEGDERPVLVAVDFSQESESALLFASDLAPRSGAPLVALHVAHEPCGKPGFYSRDGGTEQILPIQDLAERKLCDYMETLLEGNPAEDALKNIRCIVVGGLPATRIVEIGEKIGAQLIVLGSDGRSRLRKLVSGSVSDAVARKSNIPVTVVHSHDQRSEHHHFPPEKTVSRGTAGRLAESL